MYNLTGDPRCYEAMLDLPRPVSAFHLPMPKENRAAQFAPFDALTGLGAAIREIARRTEARRELDEDQKAALNTQLLRLRSGMTVTVVRFLPDPRKEGGAYVRTGGVFRRLGPCAHTLCLCGEAPILVEDIVQLELHDPDPFYEF